MMKIESSLCESGQTQDDTILVVDDDCQLADRARLIGATDYLAKPFNIADLLRVIGHHLGAARPSSATAQHA